MVAAYRVSILQRDTYDDATRVGEFRKLFAERDVASFSPIAQMDDRSQLFNADAGEALSFDNPN